jgi:hypothetical protein
MPQVQTWKVMFEVAEDIELATGIVLPAGSYTGTETRTKLGHTGSGQDWMSRYHIELTADELVDVTRFVHSGRLIVA